MTLIPVSKISVVGDRSLKAGGSRWIGQRSVPSGSASAACRSGSPSTFQSRPSVDVADRHGDRLAGVDDVDAARRGRRSSPWRPRGRGRRRGAAAPPRSARLLAVLRPGCRSEAPCRSPAARSVKTASMTTPLISITLPTFRSDRSVQACVSWARMSGAAGAAARRRLPSARQSTEAWPRTLRQFVLPCVVLERRHPGGVVDASAVRAEQ